MSDHLGCAATQAAQKPTRVTIQSFDGLTLSAQWIPRENARGTLDRLHGYRSSPVIDLYAGLSHYYALGFSLLICDQRAHGASAPPVPAARQHRVATALRPAVPSLSFFDRSDATQRTQAVRS